MIADNGVIERAVPVDTTSGTLRVWIVDDAPNVWELKIGHLDPIAEDSGVEHRLRNLGFDDTDLADAIRRFQTRVGLEATGTIDDALRDALAAYYDAAKNEREQEKPAP